MKMTVTDAKVYALNTTALMVSFSTVEDALKLCLLIASLGYTIHKWYALAKSNSIKKENEQ